jgi:hypothetical protein
LATLGDAPGGGSYYLAANSSYFNGILIR